MRRFLSIIVDKSDETTIRNGFEMELELEAELELKLE